MKKFLSGFIAGILIASIFSVFAQNAIKKAYFNDNITIKVNGIKQDVQALSVILEGSNNASTYLPLRKTAELLGKDINWDADTNTADIVEKKVANNTTSNVDDGLPKYTPDGVRITYIDGKGYISKYDFAHNYKSPQYLLRLHSETRTIPTTFKLVYKPDSDNPVFLLRDIPCFEIDKEHLYIPLDYYINYIIPEIQKIYPDIIKTLE